MRRLFPRLPSERLTAAGDALLTLGLLWAPIGIGHAATLPIPCSAGSCAANKTPGFTSAPAGFVTSGQAAAAVSGNTLTVSQASSQAILNWSSFNVSADGKVVFQQPSASAVALNKIYQASPSSIFGELTANGQIYLINPNGFVFGNGATVNVAGLMASSLGLVNESSEIANGLPSQVTSTSAQPALQSDGRIYVTDASGNLVPDAQGNPQAVQVVVQPGATLTAAQGGRIMLVGQEVTNGGTISAPQGQIVLAAGQTAYLETSGDSSLRGLIVEVDNTTPQNGTDVTSPSGSGVGTTTNSAGGVLSTPQGNVSLIGLAVNQSGRISATTTVSQNGSIVLQAAEGGAGVGICTNGLLICAMQGGTLTIGATSDIDASPDLSDTTTAPVAQPQQQSTIQLTGEKVDIEGGQITAADGNLSVLAAADPNLGLQTEGNTAAQIRVAPGTSIDLAGNDAVLPMSANLLPLQLLSNELEDDPDQRTGALHGDTVIVDVRNGKPPIVSESSWLSALQGIEENISQRTSQGGTATFQSEGDVVVASGATINVSGGTWTYEPGVVQTSQLIASNGHTYDIGTASPDLTYTGVLNPTYTQTYNGYGVQITSPTPGVSHTESGYVEGFSAGTVTFAAPTMVLQGTLLGSAVNGPYQRSAESIPSDSLAALVANGGTQPSSGAAAMAMGGTLVIGDPAAPAGSQGAQFFGPAVIFTESAPPVVVSDDSPLPQQTLELPISYITSGGFQSTEIFSDYAVTVPAGLPLNLGAGASLLAIAPRVTVDSSITALGGSINLESAQTGVFQSSPLNRLGIDIADGVTLDVSGQWTNDSTDAAYVPETATYQDGGSIVLSLTPSAGDLPAGILPASATSLSAYTSGGQLEIGNGVSLLANGGAWVNYTNAVAGGTGGRITIDASPYQSALQVGSNVTLEGYGVQGAAGGSVALEAPRIAVVQGDGTWAAAQRIDDLTSPGGIFDVGAGLFSQDGFSSVDLVATAPVLPDAPTHDVLTVTAGTAIVAQAQTLELQTGYLSHATGGEITGLTAPETLPVADQTPSTVNLQVVPGITDPVGQTVIGDVNVELGSSIVAGPGGDSGSTIDLASQGSVIVDGTLRAPGGVISAQITPPPEDIDPGYVPSQRIEIGPEAVLDVSGAAVMTPNSLNLPLGTVLAGGTVNLIADRGEVVTDPGSYIDIAGGSALLDEQLIGGKGGYVSATMGSAGGSLLVESSESASLLGGLSAAGGASSSGTLAGGALELDLSNSYADTTSGLVGSTFAFNEVPYTIELLSSTSGVAPSAPTSDLALLGIAQLQQSGIGKLTLSAGGTESNAALGTIELDSDEPLSLAQEITLDAPNIAVSPGTAATLKAPYVVLTDSPLVTSAGPATAGSGSLTVDADEISLSGYVSLQGVQDATLNSCASAANCGDVQLDPLPAQFSGGLTLDGNLTINAARVYPATFSTYTIDDSDASGTVQIERANAPSSAASTPPLSAGGSLTIDAANITSSGILWAPFGQITLDATNTLTLANGSVTSVSAGGSTLPYGETTFDEEEWVYEAASNNTQAVTAIPSRTVTLQGAQVNFASGATVDVSGGGDLSAYEWVPGLGGSTDALGQASASASGLYAIIPGSSTYAAYDAQEFNGSNVTVGQSVYLSGVAGLPAGTYTLLPARYGLLPGAYLIQVEPSYQSQTAGEIGALGDGTPIVAGYFTYGNTGLRVSSGYTGFAVWPGSYSQSLAQYTISDASTFFAAQEAASAAAGGTATPVALPADAGNLTIAVGTSLIAQGTVNAAVGTGGAGATVDLYTVGPGDLTVTANGQPAASGVSIEGSVLQSWNAGDLILGGALGTSADGSPAITVTADSVTVAAGAQLSADQVLMVAEQSIDIQSGATVASTSGLSGTAPKTPPALTTLDLLSSGGGSSNSTPAADTNAAFFALSDTELPVIGNRADDASSGQGSIEIAQGATISTRGAVSLDAPGLINMDPNSQLETAGASWSLASQSVAFVPVSSGSSGDTLQIASNSSLLSALQAAGSVRIASGSSIDILTPTLDLGATSASSAPTLQSLTLIGTSINNVSGGSVTLGAQTLTLEGTGSSYVAPTAGSGSLTLVANDLNIGVAAGQESGITESNFETSNLYLDLNGNAQTTLVAAGAVVGAGTGQLSTSGNVSVAAPELTALSESNATLYLSSGNLQVAQAGTAASPATLTASLGGGLTLSANGSIADTGSIIVPGGRISLLATSDILLGSAVTPGASATVDAGGIPVEAMGVTEGAAGGIVDISAGGNLALPSGVTIDVSGASASGAVIAPGGTLTLSGNTDGNPADAVTLGATLLGNGTTGGSFSLYANQLTGGLSSALVNTLTTGGFTNAVSLEVASGDLDLQQGSTLTANDVTLTADSGGIDIAGTLDAPSGNLRGSIGLFANGNVVLESTGALLANGDSANGQGGEIELSTVGGTIMLDGGSAISATGTATAEQSGAMGTLLLRAPAIVQSGGVGIAPIASTVDVGTIVIEPVLPAYQYSSIGDFTQSFGQIQSDVQSYVGGASQLVSSIVPAGYDAANGLGARAAILEPGIVVEASAANGGSGDIVLSQSLDLSQQQLGAPIDLTVRAAGSLDIEGTLSDGYSADPNTGATTLNAGASSSLRFVAGANLASADPLATVAGSNGSLTIGIPAQNGNPAQGALVRTGTGDIDLAASGDVIFTPGSTAYTSGISAAPQREVSTNSGSGYITYAELGGNLSVAAGHDVIGVTTADSAATWQLRSVLPNGTGSTAPKLGTYGVDLDQFDESPWTLATFGGGDLSITAGSDVVNVSAAAADSLAISGSRGSYTQAHYSSGNLSVQADGNITTGQFLVADGTGILTAGQSFNSNLQTALGTAVGSLFYVESGRLSLWAEGDIIAEGVMNPTVLGQTLLGNASANYGFFTYGSDSAFSAQSTGGTIVLNNDTSSLRLLLGAEELDNYPPAALYDYPGSVSLRSLTGDVVFGNASLERILYPTDDGQLEIFAAQDVVDETGSLIAMSDALASDLPTASSVGGGLVLLQSFPEYNFNGAIHANDPAPASIVAGRDIQDLTLSIPKAADIEAGQDIVGLTYYGQNLNPSDLTLIYAGKNFIEPLVFAANGNASTTTGVVEVGGPGRLDLLAGGTIDLGFSEGVTTTGNLQNANLATASGADITMMAGFGQAPSYATFLSTIVEQSSAYEQQLVSYVESVTGQTGLSLADAQSQFNALGPDLQRPFIDSVFFSELNASGLEATANPSVGYSQGYAAIEALFPNTPQGAAAAGSNPYQGDIDLTYSQVYTESGGSIDLLDPGGSINVGLANAPAGTVNEKAPQQLGIVAVGSGDVNIYAEGDVNVNTSRIFTLGGGNIVIWSEEGNIDAGNGAKTSLSVPPPTIEYDKYGNPYYAYDSAVAGSGIRTIQSNPSVPAGNVNLIAPVGFVNAGDAGIGAAGNINISALAVIGTANINFGGTATGVPALVSNITASVSSAASTASATTTSAQSLEQNANPAQQAPLAQAALSWLDVFVLGLGEDNCDPSDADCLKRQQHE